MNLIYAARPARRAGFTLVEVTVVVTIMVVLAALLFPVFGRAREASRKTICLNNLYQVGTALQLYARDYDGRFPPTDQDLRPLTQGYLTDASVLRCPSEWVPESAWKDLPGPFSGSYQYRGGRSIEDRADLPIVGEWAFNHHEGGVALTVSGSAKFQALKYWVPITRGPRPLPAGFYPPPGLRTAPLIGEKPRDGAGSSSFEE